MIKYFKTTTAIILFILLAVPTAYGLSKPTTLKNLKVSVWPEYDKPSEVLVIFRGQLANNARLPAKVRFLLPNNAQLSSTSSVDKNDKFQYTKEWNSKKLVQKKNFTELTYNVYYPTFQFELYNQVDTEKDKRVYSFPLKTAMNINNLLVEIQQPLRSKNFKISPKNASSRTDDNGFNLKTYNIGKIKANTQKTFSFTYTKSDIKPSVEGKDAQPIKTSTNQLPSIWIIAAIVAALLAIGTVIFLRFTKEPSVPGAKTNSSDNKPFKAKRGRFCTQCGTRLNPGSSFCHVCGKKL